MSELDQIVVQCPACKGRMRASRSSIGSRVGCPTCQAAITVVDPLASASAPMIVDPHRKLGVAPRGGETALVESGFKDRLRHTSEPSLKVDPEHPTMVRRDFRKEKHGDTLTNWDRQPRRRHHRHRRGKGLIMALSITAGVLALLLAGIFAQRILNNTSPVTGAPLPRPLELQSVSDFHDEVWQKVQEFCAAPNPQALLAHVRDPERVAPLIKRFYNSDNPWIPIALGGRPELSSFKVHRDFVLVLISLADYRNRTIGLEKTPEGFRVDWESFVGYSELSWAELRRTKPRKPVLLRAVIRPDDYFNLDFPSAETHRCYQISDFNGDYVLYGYVPIDSDIERQIQKTVVALRSPLDVNALVIRVRYPEPSSNERQVEITELLEKGWIFREDDIPESPLELSPTELTRPPVQTSPDSGPAKPAILPGLTKP